MTLHGAHASSGTNGPQPCLRTSPAGLGPADTSGRGRFTTRWVPLKQATAHIIAYHRHHRPPQGAIVALGIWRNTEWLGVGVLGRPVSRVLQAEGAIEVTRLCIRDNEPHAASHLLAKLRRVGQALGFAKIITYTLASEPGASLRAAGWREVARVVGREWTTPSRPRGAADFPTEDKCRWEAPT